MGKKRNKLKNLSFIESAVLNDMTFQDYLDRLQKVALSIFEWVNLPDTMNARYIEECLFFNGKCAFLWDDNMEYINTKATSNGYLNIYGIPKDINCYSYGYHQTRKNYTGLSKPDKKEACIYVLNNYEGLPTIYSLALYAYRLYECQRSWDINIKNQKFPLIIATTEEQRMTLENFYSQLDGNKPAIVVDKNNIDLDTIKAIKTEVPFVADKLTKEKKEILNEALTFLGINNIDIEKKERMISGEVEGNNEFINLNLQSFLIPRQYACDLFNQLFELDEDNKISVRVRSDLHNVIKEVQSTISDLKPLLNEVDKNE